MNNHPKSVPYMGKSKSVPYMGKSKSVPYMGKSKSVPYMGKSQHSFCLYRGEVSSFIKILDYFVLVSDLCLFFLYILLELICVKQHIVTSHRRSCAIYPVNIDCELVSDQV